MARTREEHERYRRYYLPLQLDATRRKMKALITEAKRMGMTDLLEPGE